MIFLPTSMILIPELPGLVRQLVSQANAEIVKLQDQIDVLRKRFADLEARTKGPTP